MKIFLKILVPLLVLLCATSSAFSQANASLNILTLNVGQVPAGNTVYIQVTVGNTGPGAIGVNKVRPQINVPTAIGNVALNAAQDGLPPGWTILTANPGGGGSIQICNGSDIIPAGAQRQ